MGFFGFDYGILDMLWDARARFLKPGGTHAARGEIELLLAPVESQACRRTVSEWRDGTVPDDYSWVSDAAANTKHGVDLGAAERCSATRRRSPPWTMGDEPAPYYAWRTVIRAREERTLDGVAGWFRARLYGDVWMSNAPDDGTSSTGHRHSCRCR